MKAPWAWAVLAVVALILLRMRVTVAPGWVVPLPALLFTATLALSAAAGLIAVVRVLRPYSAGGAR